MMLAKLMLIVPLLSLKITIHSKYYGKASKWLAGEGMAYVVFVS